jgi:hypothetical protein
MNRPDDKPIPPSAASVSLGVPGQAPKALVANWNRKYVAGYDLVGTFSPDVAF